MPAQLLAPMTIVTDWGIGTIQKDYIAYRRRLPQLAALGWFDEVYRRGEKEGWWNTEDQAAAQLGITRAMLERILNGLGDRPTGKAPPLSTVTDVGERIATFARWLGITIPLFSLGDKRRAIMLRLLGRVLDNLRSKGQAVGTLILGEHEIRVIDALACREAWLDYSVISDEALFNTWINDQCHRDAATLPIQWILVAHWFALRAYLPGFEDALITLERTPSRAPAAPSPDSLEFAMYELRALREAIVKAYESLKKPSFAEASPAAFTTELCRRAEKRLPRMIRGHDGKTALGLLDKYGLDVKRFVEPSLPYNSVGYLALESPKTQGQVQDLLRSRADWRGESDG